MASALFFLTGLVSPSQLIAAPVPWLYDVDLAVEGRGAEARVAVSGAALAEVLSRVSGLAHVPRNAVVREALNRPEAYYNRFVFLDGGTLRIHFMPSAILKLVDEARLPIWSANRPRIMVWLVVEDRGRRQILHSDHRMAEALRVRARQRGIILKLPLMDLEDSVRVPPAVVGGRIFAPLKAASRRYGAEVIVVGRVWERACRPAMAIERVCGPREGTYYAGSLEAWLDGGEFATNFSVPTLAEAGRGTADFIADELAGRFAVLARERNRLALTVRGIDSPVRYGRLLAYLESLEFVAGVEVVSVDVDRLAVGLHTRAALDQLLELFERDGRVGPDPTGQALLVWTGT